jgi:hypothetical protein
MVKKSVMRMWWALAVMSVLSAGAASAQDAPAPAAGTATQGPTAAPDAPGGAGQMAAAIGGMIGGAEFMLILDKPFEAEKLFGAVLQMDPNNAYAKQGLERVKLAKRPNWTILYHNFRFNLDMSLNTYGGGPSFYSKNLKSTFWIGDGWYKNNINPDNPQNPLAFLGHQLGTADDKALRKQTYNVTLEPYYKQFDGYFYVNRTVYQEAPDRTLWTAQGTWTRQPGRESYALFAGQHDSYFQGQLAQYFAPESWSAVQVKLLSREVGFNVNYPIGKYIDINPTFQRISYTDDNTRRFFRAAAMYRLLPGEGKQMPIFRVGFHFVRDDADHASLLYYAPPIYHQYSIAADYTFISGNTRYGVYGYYPVNKINGEAPILVEPPKTLFAFINHKISARQEFWFKFAGLHTKHDGPRFGDYVFGMNYRF